MDVGCWVYCLASYLERHLDYLFNFCSQLMKYPTFLFRTLSFLYLSLNAPVFK